MRRLAFAFCLAAACSSETPASIDAQVADVVLPTESIPQGDLGDAPPDVAAEDRPDVWIWTDPVPLRDDGVPTPDVIDASAPVDVVDAGQLADVVVPADAPDVIAAPDVVDAGTGLDAPDAAAVDAATDAPAAADVRDAGPADAGPVVYDLNAVRTGLEVRVVYRQFGSLGNLDCEAVADMTNCFVASGTLNFSLRGCGRTFTGLIPLSGTSGRLVTASGSSRNVNDFTPVVVAGRTAPRQSFRIGIAMMPDGPAQGFTGIPGRTVDPARGDLWLLGCEVR